MVKIILIAIFIAAICQSELKAQSTKEGPEIMTGMVITDRPVFKGDLKQFIQGNIQYPATALRDSVAGRVIVGFLIDTLGITKNHKVLKGIRNDLDTEALRIARLIKFDSPAMQYHKVIRVEYQVPVDFILDKNIYKQSKAKKKKLH